MIHTAKVLVFAPGGMAALFEFLRERLRSLFRASAVKRDELPRHEVAGVGRNDVEETGLLLGVAEAFECNDVFLRDFHRERMSGRIPREPRTRRRRPASPCGVYKENPARVLSARSEEHTSELQSLTNLV